MTKAASRARGELMKGSAAMSGEMRIRPSVIAFGRFTCCALSGQSLQYQLADGLESVEHAIPVDRDCLEVGNALDPVAAGKLIDEVLSRVIRVGRDSRPRGLGGLPARVQRGLQLSDWRGVRKVSFVVLDDERHTSEVVAVFRHVVVEVLHRLEVCFHSLDL